MTRFIAGTLLAAMGSPIALRRCLAQAIEASPPETRANFDRFIASKAIGAYAAEHPMEFAPPLKEALAAFSPMTPAPGDAEYLAVVRGITACINPESRLGAIDPAELKQDISSKLTLASLPPMAVPGWGTVTSALINGLGALSPDAVDALVKWDKKNHLPHERIVQENLEECYHRVHDEELRLLRKQKPLTGAPVSNPLIGEELRKRLPPGFGQPEPNAKTIVKLPHSAQQMYSAVNQGRVKTKQDAEKVAAKAGQQTVNRVASTRSQRQAIDQPSSAATQSKPDSKSAAASQEAFRKTQADARQQYYYNIAEVNGVAQVGGTLIQLMGGSSQDAQKFAGAISAVGGAALTVSAYMAGTLALGPFAVAGAVAAGVMAIVGLFKEDQSSQLFVALAEAVRSLGKQLEAVQKNQLLIIEGLQQIQQDLSNFQFENRDLLKRITDKITQLQSFMQAVYQNQWLNKFNSSSRNYADALEQGLKEDDVLTRLDFCRDLAIDGAYAPEFTWGNPAEKRLWSSQGSIGGMSVLYGGTIREFGGNSPAVSSKSEGRKSSFPYPRVWRLGAAHFMAAALQADARKVLALDSEKVRHRAKTYLLPIYNDGRALRQACVTMSSPDLVRKAIERMRDLLGLSANDLSAPKALQVLRRVAEEQDKKSYGGYTLTEEDSIWRSVTNGGRLPKPADFTYYEIDGRLFEISKGVDPLKGAIGRGIIRENPEQEARDWSNAVDLIINAPLSAVPGQREGYVSPRIRGISAKRKRQPVELVDLSSGNKIARYYRDRIKWSFDVQDDLWRLSENDALRRSREHMPIEGECIVIRMSTPIPELDKLLTRLWSATASLANTSGRRVFPQRISSIPDLLEICAALLRESDRQNAANVRSGVPKTFMDELRKVTEGSYMTKVEDQGSMLNLMIAMANWRSIPELAEDFPIWAATHSILCTDERFEAFIKNWYLQQEPREKYADELVKAFRELYEADFQGIQEVVDGVDPQSSIAIVDQTLAAMDTFLTACKVPHESYLTT